MGKRWILKRRHAGMIDLILFLMRKKIPFEIAGLLQAVCVSIQILVLSKIARYNIKNFINLF